MHQTSSTSNLATEELPQESPSLLYPSQLASDEPVTPPFIHQHRPLTQATPLLLQVLEAPKLTEKENQPSSTTRTITMKPPSIPEPLQLTEGSLTQDLREETEEATTNNNTDNNNTDNKKKDRSWLVDFVEWHCHKLMKTETPSEIEEVDVELNKALNPLPEEIHYKEFGRLANRLQLASLSLDAGRMKPGIKPEGESYDYYSGDLGADTWSLYREQLILFKSMLLRKDANVDSCSGEDGGVQIHPNAAPDKEREQHPLFQKEYRRVARLLRVQECLATFRQALLDASKAGNAKDESTGRIVQKAVDEYEGKINVLFGDYPNPSDDCSVKSLLSIGSDVRQLPQELVGFLLKDLYSKTADVSATQGLPERLLRHVERVVFDVSGHSTYSHAATRRALRDLLCQWQEYVLETPTLVQLGYGMDPKTASPSRKRAEAEEDAMLRRLSTCGGNPAEDVSDFGDSDHEEEGPSPKKRKIEPVKWEDSSSSSDDADGDSEESSIKEEEHVPFQPRRGSMQELSSLYAKSRRRTPLIDRRPSSRPAPKPKRPSSPLSLTSDPEEETRPAKPAQQRRQFTEEETQAIVEGVAKYGVGKWRIIKDNSDGKLDARDTVQIKDKYRNLVNKGLI